MQDLTLASPGHGRHGFVDVVFGAAVALVAIAVAQAAPTPRHAAKPRQVASARPSINQCNAPAPGPAAAPPPVLIAFKAPLPDGTLGSPFGLRQLPWEVRARLHAGVDLEAPGPEPILAAADGVVTRMGDDPGYGRFVEIKHAEGLTTVYGHMARFARGMASGVAVKAGTEIGRLGSTGSSTGAHLHFEVHDPQDRPMDPEMFLGKSFATVEEMPLKAAAHVPRRVRVAYVSRIPRSKRAMMEARLDPGLEAAASDAAAAGQDAAAQVTDAAPARHWRHTGRIHSRLRG